MGQQQLLLIILGVIIVGIAIAVGLSLFSAQSIESNKDAMVNDINNINAHAYQYFIRPVSMGGGGGSFTGYKIPTKMSSNDNATYSCGTPAGTTIQVDGNSVANPSSHVIATFDAVAGKVTGNFSFSGVFQ